MQRAGHSDSDRVVRQFALAALFWGLVGMAAGALLALVLVVPELELPAALSFGRLRPVHTTTVVFALVGNLVFAGIYYSCQRLLRVPLAAGPAAVHFWGWQALVAAGVATLLLGHGQGKELAELEWPLDLALAALWLVFAGNVIGMVRRRREVRLYISIWFYLATVVAVGALHLANALALPLGALDSVPLLAGAADAMLQRSYGEAAVGFFLVVPLLGLVYHVLPEAAAQPVHSARLAVVHFWGLVVALTWMAPRRLLDTALPDRLQVAGVVFGLLLWVPAWAGVINGLLTLRGAGARLRRDPVLKFTAAALVFHGLAALEVPLSGTRAMSELTGATDWQVGHAHLVGLGFSGLMAAALLYWLAPRLWGAPLRSVAAAHAHFYLAVLGLVLYVAAMWIAGATQGVMWRDQTAAGGLTHHFLETVAALDLSYWGRLVGGALYLVGFLLLGWNVLATRRAGVVAGAHADEAWQDPGPPGRPPPGQAVRLLLSWPVAFVASIAALVLGAALVNPLAAFGMLLIAVCLGLAGVAASAAARAERPITWHQRLEGSGRALGLLVVIAVLAGPALQVVPLAVRGAAGGQPPAPLGALELEGQAVYLREGCATCHTQMIRPFLWEVARYGEVSTAADSAHDHPSLWGSRRVGPDLARIGGRTSNLWHYQHLMDPRSSALRSTMPSYRHLAGERIDLGRTADRMRALRSLGVPYGEADIAGAERSARAQAGAIAAELRAAGAAIEPDSRMVALIAYLQRLGQEAPPPPTAPPPERAR